jgi:hypothetical protein
MSNVNALNTTEKNAALAEQAALIAKLTAQIGEKA